MTVAITTSSIAYVGNGATVAYPTTFKFLKQEHLVVTVTPSGGVAVVQTLGVHYTVAGVGLDAGGTVTFVAAPANLAAISIKRDTPVTQDTNFRTQGSFSPAVHENEFDKSALIDQELKTSIAALQNAATTNTAVAGNGLAVAGSTWNVGAGNGIIASADAIAVDYGLVGSIANVTKAASSAGVSNQVARADHKHDVTTAVAGAVTIGAAAAEGASASLARADHVHSLAAPAAPADVTKAAAAVGVSTAPARADHKHDVTTAAAVTLGVANAEGAATTLARSDHVHNHGAQTDVTHHAVATPVLNGFMPATDKRKFDNIGATYGGTIQTADATTVTIAEREVDANSLEIHEVMIVGCRSTRAEGVGYMLIGTFRRDGGVVAQVGATTVVATHEDAGAVAWTAAFAVSATSVQVRVTGEVAKTVNWRARGRICEVASP